MLIQVLTDKAMDVMKSLDYTQLTIDSIYSASFKPIIDYYLTKGIDSYDPDLNCQIESMYLEQFHNGTISRRTYYKRLRGIRILKEVYETGNYIWEKYTDKILEPEEEFSLTISECLSKRNICPKNLRLEKIYLSEFSKFCSNNGIGKPDDINGEIVLRFIKFKGLGMTVGLERVSTTLSKYLLSLFEKEVITRDLSAIIKIKSGREFKVKLPFNIDVLSRLIASIDTDTELGKRDYAIILLVSYTGIRSCDIINLKLNDISWKDRSISFVQNKTGIPQSLPLNKEVCDALADYILNGRPKCGHSYVFVRELSPFNRLHDSCALNSMLRRRLSDIGIERKPGDGLTIHGIRRALGTQLIKSSSPVNTVAQVLGHQSTRATRQYISVDIEGLRMCALSFDSIGYGVSL